MSAPASYVAALTVLGGPLKGRNLLLQESVDDVLIGSDPDCRLIVDLPGVSPLHARIWIDSTGATVYDTRSARGVYVNDDRVITQAALKDGDFLWLGPPGDPDSALLQFRHQLVQAPPGVEDAWAIAEPASDLAEPVAQGLLGELLEPPFVVEEPAPSVLDEDEKVEARLELEEFVVEPDAGEDQEASLPTAEEFVIEAPEEEKPVTDAFAPILVHEPPEEVAAPPATPRAPEGLGASPAVVPLQPPLVEAPPTLPPAAPAAVPERVPLALRIPAPAPVRQEVRRPAPTGRGKGKWLALGLAVLVALGVGAYLLARHRGAPRIEGVSSVRVAPGEKITVTGRNFSAEASGNVVRFGGQKEGRLLKASSVRLEVEVPELPIPVGRPSSIPLAVKVGGRESKPVQIMVYRAPRVHGISPNVAMPGEEIALAGSGWGPGARVKIGGHDAEVLEVTPVALRVRVPAVTDAPGTALPVVVSMGEDASNPAPFLIGRLPLIAEVDPRAVSPGDVIIVRGRGFGHEPASTELKVGGYRALVVSVTDAELKAVVPRTFDGSGELPVELKVPGSPNVGATSLNVAAPQATVDFRFVAEPWVDVPGHDHALLATGLGPVLVLSASGGRSAADRALQAQERLNLAAGPLKAALTVDVEVRLGADPVIGLVGKDEALVEVSEEDAAAYNEDWTKLKGKGGPVTRARLALWWGAVQRDLVLLLLRGEKPRHAAALAPEGRVLPELHDVARKTAPFGVPQEVAQKAPPRLQEGLRIMALRIPPTVKAPQPVAQDTSASSAQVRVEGVWSGSQTEGGDRKFITVAFKGDGGTLTFERGLALTLPLLRAERPQKDTVRFSLQSGTRLLRYVATWDGERMKGKIFSEADGQTEIGSFELERKR